MKKVFSVLLTVSLLFTFTISPHASSNESEPVNSIYDEIDLGISAKSVCLVEATTGSILYAKNENAAASPASVTKVMSLILVCEAIEAGGCSPNDIVTVSSYAASMGGSQVFLEEGERFTVEELLKCAVIASANDAIVALAEFVAGTEKNFVSQMNAKAIDLGLKNTSFENSTGLDDTTVNHFSSAIDIAVMSRELIKYDIITKYSSMWQDSIRNGEFTLTNTNRLVRYYEGCNGLKTGSTDKAGYCVSATAKRDNMQLIAVVMGADTRDARNADARTLLDYGFANYMLYEHPAQFLENIPVRRGTVASVPLYSAGFSTVISKSKARSVEITFDIPDVIAAPIAEGTEVGNITYKLDGVCIGTAKIAIKSEVTEVGILDLFLGVLRRMIYG